jgi:hypothetical protein
MTAGWQRPEPERPLWRTRGGHDYQVGDPFGFDAMGRGRWVGTAIERAPNDWLRIRVESATRHFTGMEGRVMAGPVWGLEPEPS